jgi:hypothetical protein
MNPKGSKIGSRGLSEAIPPVSSPAMVHPGGMPEPCINQWL